MADIMKTAKIDRALRMKPNSRVDVLLRGLAAELAAGLVVDGKGAVNDGATWGCVVDMVVNV